MLCPSLRIIERGYSEDIRCFFIYQGQQRFLPLFSDSFALLEMTEVGCDGLQWKRKDPAWV